ncbi:MotE family protein [Terricaulis sp.]|uniref:MotE family protein n=1 Tax=Terricaulis sp. TaxID=2768686 RepID=UPI003782D830
MLLFRPAAPKPRKPRAPAQARLFPAVMAGLAALLGLKTVALAQSVTEAPHAQTAQTEDHAAPAQTPAQQPAATASCVPTVADMAGLSQAEVQVLQALGARRDALNQRATALETQDDLMLAAERRLDERLAELHTLETTVNDLLGRLDEAQEQRLAGLVDVYQRMRAKDAAAVFDGLDDDVLVQVASRMRQANLAEVMGRMTPERARRLTTMLAERARPPRDGEDLLARTRGTAPTTTPTPRSGG